MKFMHVGVISGVLVSSGKVESWSMLQSTGTKFVEMSGAHFEVTKELPETLGDTAIQSDDDVNEEKDETKQSDFPLYFDGFNLTKSTVKVEKSPPFKQVLRFTNCSEIKIETENSLTVATLPLAKMLQAQFVKTMATQKVTEYGIANFMFGPNLPTFIPGMKPLVGAALKMHTLAYKGKGWKNDTYNAVKNELENRTPQTDAFAEQARFNKSYLANRFVLASRLGMQLVVGAGDTAAVDAMTGLVGKAPPANFSKRTELLLEELRDASKDFSSRHPISNAVACLHFEELEEHRGLVRMGADKFTLQLNTPIRSYAAQQVSHPLQHFLVTRGISVVTYDNDVDELVVSFQGATLFDAVDPDSSHDHISPNPQLYVGPLGDNDKQPSLGHRLTFQVPNRQAFQLWQEYDQIPMDYNHQFRADLCSDKERAEAIDALSAYDVSPLFRAIHNRDAEKVKDLVNIQAKALANSVDCALLFIRAPIDNSHGYGIGQAMALNHAVMEAPGPYVAKMVFSKDWDKLKQSEFSQDTSGM